MIGTTFQPRDSHWHWVQALTGLTVLAVVFLIWQGPLWAIGATGVSLTVAVVSLVLTLRKPSLYPNKWILFGFMGFHVVLISVGVALKSLLLSRLPETRMNLPRLTQVYVNPDGAYALTGPTEWDYAPINSPNELGLKIQPRNYEQYMGASDLQVWIREMNEKPKSGQAFIEKMAKTLSTSSKPPGTKKEFEFRTETVKLLNGEKGILSILDLKKFWVPIRQVTLFGMVNDRYLCSVSVTGLKSHSTLSKVLCIGIFETIKIPGVVS